MGFLKGQIVKSRVNGKEFEVARDQRADSHRFCILRIVAGVGIEDWKDEENYDLVVAESEEAFDEQLERVEVEVGEDLFGDSDFESVDPLKFMPTTTVAPAPRRKDWRMFYDNSSSRRKEHPVMEGFLKYFPAAVRLVSEVSRLGNDKHNPGEPLHHARDKSGDHLDCAARHLLDADSVDGDLGIIEAVNAIWRLCAYVQEKCEREYGWPKAPNARGEAKR
jgi:hypothetical protein